MKLVRPLIFPSRITLRNLFLSLLIGLLAGCYVEDNGQARLGSSLEDVEYKSIEPSWIIAPSQEVLTIDDNPFRNSALSGSSKWQLYSWVLESKNDRAMVGVYLWATVLAKQANGENQYYTARSLEALSQSSLTPDSDLDYLQDLAIESYTAVLDQFPSDVTYGSQGQALSLATMSYISLVKLGGSAPQGWTLIDTDSGPKAVRD